jgi:type I restriction enzyme S subunit
MRTIPPGWVVACGEDLFSSVRGVSYKKADVSNAPGRDLVPVLRANSISNGSIITDDLVYVPSRYVSPEQYLRDGDLLIAASSGSRTVVGKAARADERHLDFAFGAFCTVARPRNSKFSLWLSWYMKTRAYREYVERVALGININNLRGSDLKAMPIFVPPLIEQQRIVTKIESLSAKSRRAQENLKRVPRLVEKYKQAILVAAFRGALTEKWRTLHPGIETAEQAVARTDEPLQSRGGRDATSSVRPGIAGLSVNNPGTDVPPGWRWVPLRRLARQETGHTPSRSHPDYWDGVIPWIGIRDAGDHHGRVINETLQTISEKGLANSSARLLETGTVCLSRTASVGYVTIMGRTMATSQDFATWTCRGALEPRFLMYAFMAEGENIRNFGEGSTHTTIYFPEIRALNICLAPPAEQQEIIRRIETAFAWIERLASGAISARTLVDRLDQAVLSKAFQGELVLQDPHDEPAKLLLERVRKEHEETDKATRAKKYGRA